MTRIALICRIQRLSSELYFYYSFSHSHSFSQTLSCEHSAVTLIPMREDLNVFQKMNLLFAHFIRIWKNRSDRVWMFVLVRVCVYVVVSVEMFWLLMSTYGFFCNEIVLTWYEYKKHTMNCYVICISHLSNAGLKTDSVFLHTEKICWTHFSLILIDSEN